MSVDNWVDVATTFVWAAVAIWLGIPLWYEYRQRKRYN